MKFIVDWKEVDRIKRKILEVPKSKGLGDTLNNTFNTLYIALLVLENPAKYSNLIGVVDWAIYQTEHAKGRLYRIAGIASNPFWNIEHEQKTEKEKE